MSKLLKFYHQPILVNHQDQKTKTALLKYPALQLILSFLAENIFVSEEMPRAPLKRIVEFFQKEANWTLGGI